MATQPVSDQLYSLQDYLALEERSRERQEFHNGYIVAMAGGTETHSRLAARMAALLDQRLKNCRVYDSNLKLYIAQANQVYYPDAMALCSAEPEFLNQQRTVLTNPTVLVEVLSPSSAKIDRGAKAEHYRSLPSVRHILLVSQDEVMVDHFERQSDVHWTVTRYQTPDSRFRLCDSLIEVREIYDRILL